MSDLFSRRLALLGEHANLSLLSQCLHGIERECLRVDGNGQLALSGHPAALGSALTNAQITTDYSESLLEFITPTATDPATTLAELERIHRFVYSKLDGEYLWSPSMPGPLPDEEIIPIARYGHSHIGQLKYVYRKGLALRYGKTMQCIAGIHYNFSLPEALWAVLQQAEGDTRSARDFQSSRYIALIRNFRRYSWLLMYLFGASPALDRNFMRGRPHQLQELDADTLYLPYATSLRMSDLGYQSEAQAGLTPCYNDLPSYTDSLRQAVATPYPPYVDVGTKKDGEWLQLNTNILQIENEYYSNIRPKRVTYSGERPIQALMARGVQYVEVRCLDINPFLPLGIDLVESRFLDAFLLFCALQDSPQLSNGECGNCSDNFLKVVKEGRRPGLHLQRQGVPVVLQSWAHELLDGIEALAALLDASQGGDAHRAALQAQRAKIDDASLTPSAQVLAQLQQGESFAAFALRQSKRHAEYFRQQPLSREQQAEFEEAAARSLQEQAELEAHEDGDFDSFAAAYQASILALAV
ncbi:glutamate--cysteine ligase [Phytopseudomonas dryadis]|uniref:Glutamate--cysteine ligase n=1 Tax=Phytopseudomonas dryadis TaxID=2487520 RepID=A0A4Q9RBC5_9GAMM|nr:MULTISPECIES: glutamate--cysteine ligase [Pseudomonas]TBU97128.1 glutamate--cysteine ligase [Pseudomonas dryadis]TBV08530.1 glutamate--cysteine ligase [Pseudomonas dryadis]TBV18899.1 glutamate--cysteine ligase [Pseudomonas sp. FRB 230]